MSIDDEYNRISWDEAFEPTNAECEAYAHSLSDVYVHDLSIIQKMKNGDVFMLAVGVSEGVKEYSLVHALENVFRKNQVPVGRKLHVFWTDSAVRRTAHEIRSQMYVPRPTQFISVQPVVTQRDLAHPIADESQDFIHECISALWHAVERDEKNSAGARVPGGAISTPFPTVAHVLGAHLRALKKGGCIAIDASPEFTQGVAPTADRLLKVGLDAEHLRQLAGELGYVVNVRYASNGAFLLVEKVAR